MDLRNGYDMDFSGWTPTEEQTGMDLDSLAEKLGKKAADTLHTPEGLKKFEEQFAGIKCKQAAYLANYARFNMGILEPSPLGIEIWGENSESD